MLALLRHHLVLTLTLTNLIIIVRSTAICYLPDKSIANSGDTVYHPCNATAVDNGEGSACCDLRSSIGSSICLTSGFCFGADSYVYRGGCTDQTWKSPNCPSQCLGGMQ